MKSKLFFLITTLILFGCIEFDSEIPLKYRRQIDHFKLNDTIYFGDNHNDIDTIVIAGIDSSEIEKNGPSNIPIKSISLNIKHLPLNNWNFGKVPKKNFKGYDSIVNQSLITINKEIYKNHDEFYLMISYRDFYGSLNFEKLEITGTDTLKTERGSFRDTLNSDSVIEVYWSNEKGMIGYKKNNGQIFKIK